MSGKAKAKVAAQSTMTLSITFQGPFLFDFKGSPENDPTVDIYAPYCPYHEAGIFFGDSAYSETDFGNKLPTVGIPPVKVARKYFIAGSGINACPNVPNQIYPLRPPRDARIKPPYNDPFLKLLESETRGRNPGKVMFQFTVPRPSYVYPQYCDEVHIVKSFDQAPGQYALMPIHATGLRFLYAWDSSTKIYLYPPGTEPSKNAPPSEIAHEITPPASGNCPGMTDHGSIDIRYQGLDLLDRNDPHADARSCLASLATMAGATEWWLDYGDGLAAPADPTPTPGRVLPNFQSYTGGDCGAPVIGHGIPGSNHP